MVGIRTRLGFHTPTIRSVERMILIVPIKVLKDDEKPKT
jgi:hypothetical protein